jgi:hypothetical protein
LRELLGRPATYLGRPHRASPAEGYASSHEAEQGRIVAEALAPLHDGTGGEPRQAGAAGRRT